MKKIAIIICFLGLFFNLSAQETTPKVVDKPVREPFSSGLLIDNQTTLIQTKNTLEMVIQHRFGTMQNGISDLYGIYAPGSSIRMGLDYVILKNLQIGWGITKLNMYNDFNVKWTIFEQTRKNTFPVAVALYANMGIDGRNNSVFGKDYKFSNRLNYFSQIIVGRKFTNWLSLQVAGSFTHYNQVDAKLDHDKIGVHFNGRIKFSPQGSFIFNYDMPLQIKGISEHTEFTNAPKPNLSFGAEVATSTHAFQIVIGTSSGLLPQEVIMYNQNDFTKGEMSIGFLITRLWSF